MYYYSKSLHSFSFYHFFLYANITWTCKLYLWKVTYFLSVYLSLGLISCKDFDHDIHWSIFITFSRSKSSIYFWICSTEKNTRIKYFLDLLLGYLWLPNLPRKSNNSGVGLPQIIANWPCIAYHRPKLRLQRLNKDTVQIKSYSLWFQNL